MLTLIVSILAFLCDGELDEKKLVSGKYILEGVRVDDNGKVETESINHKIGDKIILKCGDFSREMTIAGHVIANSDTNTDGSWMGSAFYLPAETFVRITGVQDVMSYAFDVADDKEADMEKFLKAYTDRMEPTMNYRSKETALSGLTGVRDTAVLIGGTLSAIIGLIGILNFINAVLTGILTRLHEFAVLQSIGMTRRQLKILLCREGTYYAVLTAIVSVILSICCSVLIVRPISEKVWFMSFCFVYRPLVILLPVLFLLSAGIPVLLYHSEKEQSLVEQMRIRF